jgi:hypothetical protein
MTRSVELLGRGCFWHGTISSLTFEAHSQLGSVGDFRFLESAIELIGIPELVEVLEGRLFRG